MLYTESFRERQKLESEVMGRWHKALNANGGIADEHLARTTAILCENYLHELKNDARLIAEDRISTGAFKGINLALLGLITRTIPNLVGAELVGVQAMPTPKAPVFTMTWHRDTAKGLTTADMFTNKENRKLPGIPGDPVSVGPEMWLYPINQLGQYGGVDPLYSSNHVLEYVPKASAAASYTLAWASKLTNKSGGKPFIFSDSIVIDFVLNKDQLPSLNEGASNNVIERYYWNGSAYVKLTDGSSAGITVAYNSGTGAFSITGLPANAAGVEAINANCAGYFIRYEYDAEAIGEIPEITFRIEEQSIKLIRRQLRGKYTVDAVQDLKVLHGINLDSEMVNMMKNELMHEINHEIISDLRKLAAKVKSLDFNDFLTSAGAAGIITSGNYDDAHKLMLDATNRLAAEIWNDGRLGYGNWILGNPTTLSFLDRVPGFVGSGVSYSGRSLSYAGSMGGKMKIYLDPTYPENELLIGFKGAGALETGYLYCPYLPITATPTLYDPNSGDPSKIFYTRYSKTFKEVGENGRPKTVILNGEYQYARMKLVNYPGAKFFG